MLTFPFDVNNSWVFTLDQSMLLRLPTWRVTFRRNEYSKCLICATSESFVTLLVWEGSIYKIFADPPASSLWHEDNSHQCAGLVTWWHINIIVDCGPASHHSALLYNLILCMYCTTLTNNIIIQKLLLLIIPGWLVMDLFWQLICVWWRIIQILLAEFCQCVPSWCIVSSFLSRTRKYWLLKEVELSTREFTS